MTTTDPQWWIDYMEGETDLRLQADLNELLALSETDRTELAKLQKLRALIRQSEPHLILSDRQAGRLHDKIMNSVKEISKAETLTKQIQKKETAAKKETVASVTEASQSLHPQGPARPTLRRFPSPE